MKDSYKENFKKLNIYCINYAIKHDIKYTVSII